MRFGSVYKLTNTTTGDTYVGITTQSVAARWKEHQYKANGRNCVTWLHRAMRKYGASSFLVEEIGVSLSRETLLQAEMVAIKNLKPTYNQSHGGEGTTGRKFSPEVLASRNAKLKGRIKTPEERARIAEGCRRAMTPERHQQVIEHLAVIRQKVDEGKRIASVRKAALGRTMSAESRAKLSASCMGRRYPQDVIDRARKSKQKSVICINNGKQYETAKHAALALGIGHRSVIRVLKGQYAAVKGLSFVYGD